MVYVKTRSKDLRRYAGRVVPNVRHTGHTLFAVGVHQRKENSVSPTDDDGNSQISPDPPNCRTILGFPRFLACRHPVQPPLEHFKKRNQGHNAQSSVLSADIGLSAESIKMIAKVPTNGYLVPLTISAGTTTVKQF